MGFHFQPMLLLEWKCVLVAFNLIFLRNYKWQIKPMNIEHVKIMTENTAEKRKRRESYWWTGEAGNDGSVTV